MQKKKILCTKHFNQIERFCISEFCEQSESAMCAQCYDSHNHQQSISIKADIIEKMIKVQKNNSSNREQQQFIKQSMETFGFIKTNLKNIMMRTINNIFSNYQTALKLYQKPQESFEQNLYKKSAQEIKKLYYYGKEKQRGKIKQINPKLIKYFLEFKVLLKELIDKLKDVFSIANFFEFLEVENYEDKNQKIKDYSLEKLELLLSQIKIPPQNFKKEDINKILKQVKQRNQVKDFQGALNQVTKCIDIYSMYPTLYFEKAYTLFELKQFQKSYINYSICIELDCSVDIAYNNRGLCLNSLKLYNQAINSFEKSIKKNVKYPNPYMNKGISYQYLDKLQQALCCYDKALQIKADYANAKLYKNQVQNIIKNRKKNV